MYRQNGLEDHTAGVYRTVRETVETNVLEPLRELYAAALEQFEAFMTQYQPAMQPVYAMGGAAQTAYSPREGHENGISVGDGLVPLVLFARGDQRKRGTTKRHEGSRGLVGPGWKITDGEVREYGGLFKAADARGISHDKVRRAQKLKKSSRGQKRGRRART